MNWQSFWDNKAYQHENPHVQVARVQKGTTSNQAEIEKIARYIQKQLDIQPDEHVLDLCCGNGILSHELAQYCGQLTGVDFSQPHLDIAQKNFPAKNLTYLQGDATQLEAMPIGPFDKINLYFSFQYFDTYDIGQKVVFEMGKKLNPGGKIFIGDVPDAAKISVFYPSWIQRIRYKFARLRGRDQMGRFWKEKEMKQMAEKAGLNIRKLSQPSDFLYQHYRVDYLLETVDGGR